MTATVRALYVGSEASRASALSTDKLEVIRAVSGIDGLKRLDDERVDCVLVTTALSDIALDHFVEKVRTDHPRTPVLLIGEESEKDDVVDALAAGAVAVVQGTDFEGIRAKIEEAVTNERLDRAIDQSERLEDAVRDLATRTARATDRLDVEEAIYEAVMGADLYEFVWLGAFDEGRIRLHYPIEGEFEPDEIAALVGGGDPGFIERAVTGGEVETLEGTADTRSASAQHYGLDAGADPTVATDGSTISQSMASAAVPLAPAEKTPNVLLLATTRDRPFDQSELELLDDLGAIAGSALQRGSEPSNGTDSADRTKQFALSLAHELRTPLGIASTHLELGRENHDEESFDRVAEALDRLNDTIDGIIELAGDEAIQDQTPGSLKEDVERAWASLDDPDAELRIDGATELTCNHELIVLALSNLFRNAIEHADGPVTVRVGQLADGFYVEDTGPGIPPDRRDQVFEWGYTTLEDGTGIGLALVKEAVDRHGWTITVTEGSDGGARFEVSGIESGKD